MKSIKTFFCSAGLFIFILLGSVFLAISRDVQAQMVSEPVTYNFTYTPDGDGNPLVQVQLSKGITSTFAVDTGAGGCFVSEKLASLLKLPIETQKNANGKTDRLMKVTGVQIGPLTANIPFYVVRDDILANAPDRPAEENVQGIIGSTMFTNNAVLFDFRQHQFTLFIGGKLTSEQREKFGMKDAVAVPQIEVENGVFSILGQINDKERISFIVDTGSDAVIISNEKAHKLKLKTLGKARNRYITFGKVKFDTSSLDSLTFGSLLMKNVEVEYPDKPLKYTTQLGMNILSHYRVLLDYPQHMAYFKPITPATGVSKASEKP